MLDVCGGPSRTPAAALSGTSPPHLLPLALLAPQPLAARATLLLTSLHGANPDPPCPPRALAPPPARSPNQRLRARILYVDPASKRVALTLQRHLISASLPVNFPMLGQVGVVAEGGGGGGGAITCAAWPMRCWRAVVGRCAAHRPGAAQPRVPAARHPALTSPALSPGCACLPAAGV